MISMNWCFGFDLVLFENVVEMVIALFYISRERHVFIRYITHILYRIGITDVYVINY